MRTILRSLTFGLATTLVGASVAQNYHWSVEGSISGCYPGQTVEITIIADGNVMFQANEPVDPGTCTFGGFYPVFATYAELTVSTQCNGMVLSLGDSAAFNFFQDTAFTSVTFDCGGGGLPDCLGIPGGPNQPGAPCNDNNPSTFNDMWSPTCICMGTPLPPTCQAAFTIAQVGPWAMQATNQSTGMGPIAYVWLMPDGSTSGGTNPIYTFSAPGTYGICLSIQTVDACTSTTCDTVFVDSTGAITTTPDYIDCMGIPNGPNMPGTVCDDGNPLTSGDVWTPACACVGQGGGEYDCLGILNGPNVPGYLCDGYTSDSSAYVGVWTVDCICVDTNQTGYDCLGEYNGTALPGTPCVDFFGTTGVWTANCICQTNIQTDCEGNPGGSALPGTPCNDGDPLTVYDTWTADCACEGMLPICQACFTFNSPAPFVVDFSNCSVPPSGENDALWELPDGSIYTPPQPWMFNSPSFTFDSAGVYPFCFTILDYGPLEGCSFCDTLYVDEQGNVTTTPPSGADCLGVVNGTDLPGTPCTVPGTILEGTWSASCVCEPNNPLPCQADFWVIQAMGSDSLPVPYELWVWNLSSGGTGNFAFTWNFGDGTSSTEAFPTHTYSGNGPYALCLTIADNNGCTDTHCDTVSINADGIYEGMVVHAEDRQEGFTINVQAGQANAVQEVISAGNIATWPNPVVDELNVAVVSEMKGLVTLTITDLDGRTVKTERTSLGGGRSQLRIATSGLNAGMYLLRITDGNANLSQRFVKTN